MAFTRLGQQDKLSESEWESFIPDKDKGYCRGFQVCTLCTVVVVVIFVALVISTNLIAKSAIEAIGTYALGVKTTVGSVALNAFSLHSSVSEIRIASPDGFDEDLMRIKRSVFDLGFWSVARQTIFNSNTPFTLEEIHITGLHVLVAQELDGTSNVGLVLHHMEEAANSTHRLAPTTRAMQTKIIAKKIQLDNISASISVLPLSQATGPVTFGLRQVLLTGVGEKSGGVTLQQLLKEIVKVVVAAIYKQAELLGGDMQGKLMDGLGNLKGTLMSIPHAKEVYSDAGKGLQSMHKWADTVGGQLGGQLSPYLNNTEAAAKAIGGMLSNVSGQAAQQGLAQVSNILGGLLPAGGDGAGTSGISTVSAAPVSRLSSD